MDFDGFLEVVGGRNSESDDIDYGKDGRPSKMLN
jgi:hypothetical protein